MGRVFICGYYNFPRGGAASNYVQYLAKVFMSMGKEVIAITNTNPEVCLEYRSYQGIHVEPVQLKKDKIGHYLDFHFRMGDYCKRLLNKYNPDSQDIIIAYSRDSSTLKAVLQVGKKTGAKTGVCLVEWFERKDFDKGLLDPLYWNSQYAFYVLSRKFDFLLPISTYIADYFGKKGCKAFCIPCLADTTEFEFTKKQISEKRIFIFPGNGKMKDALAEMLRTFSKLSTEELNRIEFHICGVSQFANQIIQEVKLEQCLGKEIIIHNWMPYEELVSLFQKAHYMLLARDISRMTMANFPSKIPEVLSYGVIPVCSRVGDYTNYYLEDGINSIIMDGCDVDTIVAAVRRSLNLSEDELRKMSESCRRTAVDKFDFRKWVEPLKEFLEERYSVCSRHD